MHNLVHICTSTYDNGVRYLKQIPVLLLIPARRQIPHQAFQRFPVFGVSVDTNHPAGNGKESVKPVLLFLVSGIVMLPASFAQRPAAAVRPPVVSPPVIPPLSQVRFPGLAARSRRDLRSSFAAWWGAPFPWMNSQSLDNNCCSCDSAEPKTLPPAPWTEPEPVPVSPPDPPVTGVIHAYNWPAASPSARVFTIVLKDGQVKRAAAVWRTGGVLNFSGVGAHNGSLKLDSVDTASTIRLNAEAGLTWPLALR